MIISDHGAQFIARFWEQLQYALGTKLIRSSAYHPQTDGQTERINQILEDMLRAFSMIRIGINACHWQNFLTTTVIKQVSRWPRSKHYTVADAKLL
jgi:transposase InsO family protein